MHSDQFSRLRTIAISVIVLGAVLLALPLARMSDAPGKAIYADYDAAVRGGAVRLGFIPPIVPHSATDIREMHDEKGTARWLSFNVAAPDAEYLRTTLVPIEEQEAIAAFPRPPKGGAWWPRVIPADAEGDVHAYRVTEPGSPPMCLTIAYDTQPRVLLWTCGQS